MKCVYVLTLLCLGCIAEKQEASSSSRLLPVQQTRKSGGGGGAARKTVLTPRILYFEHCGPERKQYLVVHNHTTVVDGRGVLYLSAFMEYLKPAKSFSMMKIILHKCREAVSSNTCEYFATWPITGSICTMMRAKNMMWSGFINSYQPDFKCPIHVGIYRVVNATIDVSLGETISHINIAGNVWTVEAIFTDENKEFYSCLKTAVHISRATIKQ